MNTGPFGYVKLVTKKSPSPSVIEIVCAESRASDGQLLRLTNQVFGVDIYNMEGWVTTQEEESLIQALLKEASEEAVAVMKQKADTL